MTGVLGIDLGKNLGWGLVGRPRVLSGCIHVVDRWSPYGAKFLQLESALHKLVKKHRPEFIGVARPFVRLDKDAVQYNDTTQNLVPMFGAFVVLNMVATAMGVRVIAVEEGDARSRFMGAGNLNQASYISKEQIRRACEQRGWAPTTSLLDETDALCVGSCAWEIVSKGLEYEMTPLFQAAAPTMPARIKRRA